MLEMNTATTTTFLTDCEEKTIARFMEIVGLANKYRDVIDPNEQDESVVQARATSLVQEFADRGYKIGVCTDKLAPMDGVDRGAMWRTWLAHNGNEVAYTDIEIKIGTIRMTEYGAQ